MNSRFQFVAGVSVLAALVTFASGASAGKPMVGSKALILPTDYDSPIGSLATVFSTGFEPAAWVLGAVEPQNGFSASGVNSPWASISGAAPCELLRHMRLVNDALVGLGTTRLVFTPNILQPANTPSQVKMQVKISNDQGADYDIVGQAPSQGFLTWRVRFSYSDASGGGPGTIFILDDPGTGIAFQDTGVLWDQAVCRELKVQVDPSAGEIRYFYNGALIYVGGIFAGTAVEQLVWVTDNFQLNAAETGDFDAINWIDSASDPVPAQAATWGNIKNIYR